MAQITASMVKDLREKTGAGMMDCKKALDVANGDMELAIEELRKTGQIKSAKKSDRATTEGRVAAYVGDGVAVLVEVLCETDFVSRNEVFGNFCDALAKRIATNESGTGDVSVAVQEREQGAIGDLVTNVGENVKIRRVLRIAPEGKVDVYLHGGGKIGVLVDVTGTVKDDKFGYKLAMHAAAANPTYLRPQDVPADVIAKEREIAEALPDLAGKPAAMLSKIIDGKISKWYSDVCLVKQMWVHDATGKTSVEKVEPGATIARFARWQVGEEI